MSLPAAFSIRPAKTADARILSRLMVDGLDSRLNDLGPWFVTLLHRHMAASAHCVCLVSEREGEVLGYAAAFASTRLFYRDFALRKGVLAGLMVLPWLFLPRNLRTALSALTYSGKAPADDPEAELVSLVVSPRAHRLGIGSALFLAVADGLRARGVPAFKITTSTENAAADAFYRRHGCDYLRQEPLYHDAQLNVYRYPLV